MDIDNSNAAERHQRHHGGSGLSFGASQDSRQATWSQIVCSFLGGRCLSNMSWPNLSMGGGGIGYRSESFGATREATVSLVV